MTMTIFKTLSSKVSLAAFLAGALTASVVSYAGEIYLSDDINLKLSRLKSKQRVMQHKKLDANLDEKTKASLKQAKARNEDCGNVDIGNISGSKKSGYGPKKVDVVIVGDVINVGNKC